MASEGAVPSEAGAPSMDGPPSADDPPSTDDRAAHRDGREVTDALVWLAVVAGGLALTALAVAVRARLGTRSAPFTGSYRVKLDAGTLLAPLVAAGVLAAVRWRWHERIRWRWLLLAGWAAASAWAVALAVVDGGNGLAGPVADRNGFLPDVARVDGHPLRFLSTYVSDSAVHTVATRQHPPGDVLLLWALRRVGATRPEVVGLLITAVGCLAVPLVAIAVRSLCHEPAARRLVPVLALAPYAVWLAVSLDAVTLTTTAAAVACGVVGSEARRSLWWAAAAGFLLGVAALFSYSAPWLAFALVVVYFVRRRPLLNVITGLAGLVPLAVAQLGGFVWTKGLTAAQVDFSVRVGPHRSWLLWAFLDLLILVIACGPAIVPAARKLRRTPGWPFLAGSVLGVGFALASGLSRGEVERSWLAFYPWLLVGAVAPERRPAAAGDPDSAPTPVLLVALGAAAAVAVEAVLRTAW